MKRKITISEQQIINAVRKIISEARRNPLTNVDESFNDFFNRILKKAPINDIFISFRDSIDVTDVNPKNIYETPTGFYTYPLSRYYRKEQDEITEKEFRGIFDEFGSDREYINFFILRTHDGVLSHETDKSTLDIYANRIKKLYTNVGEVGRLCDSFIEGSYLPNHTGYIVHETHLFWLLLHDVVKHIKASNKQTRVNLICRNIGVNGFVDYGNGYIYEYEETQAVFFKVKNIGEVFIYESPKNSNSNFKDEFAEVELSDNIYGI